MVFPRKVCLRQGVTPTVINEIIDCLHAICPINGPRTRVSRSSGGSIVEFAAVSARAPVVQSLTPFAVRWHADQWEVYLPAGSLAVGRDCVPLNRRANLSAGHGSGGSADSDDWYMIVLDESEGQARQDASGNQYREWSIVLHGKPRACRTGVDEPDGPVGAALYVDARKVLAAGETESDDGGALNRQGDTFERTVAMVRVTVSGGVSSRSVSQIVREPISVSCDVVRNCEPVWWFSTSSDGSIAVDRLLVVRNLQAVAGATVEGPDQVDVAGAEHVYMHIHTDQAGDHVAEIVMDPSDATADESNTWIHLFDLEDDCVVGDYRITNLSNVQLYR